MFCDTRYLSKIIMTLVSKSGGVKKINGSEISGIDVASIDYKNELLLIAQLLNCDRLGRKNRTETYREFTKTISYAILSSINAELNRPQHAKIAYRELLEKQVFGPVSPFYIEYFDDIERAETELYNSLKQIIVGLELENTTASQ